ncbi:hypothetical protein ACJ73_07396, partial [Blastomyces percursus]
CGATTDGPASPPYEPPDGYQNIFNADIYAVAAQDIPSQDQEYVSGLQYLPFTFLTGPIITPRGELSICIDTGAGISLIDAQIARLFFPKHTPARMPQDRSVGIRGVGSGTNDSNLFITTVLTLKANDGSLFAISGEFHLVRYLGCNLIVANDVLSPAKANIDLHKEQITFFETYVVRAKATRGAIRAGKYPPSPQPPRERKKRRGRDAEDANPLQIPTADTPAGSVDADISTRWKTNERIAIQSLVDHHHKLFSPDLVFSDGIKMPLRFTDEKDFAGLKQRPYPLSRKDRDVIDHILDPLLESGRIERVPLGDRNPIASPAFVVWHNGKPRVVVDLRKVNLRLLPNAYPHPTQQDVLHPIPGRFHRVFVHGY